MTTEKNLQHILVYTDFTDVGCNAINHAVEIARIFKKQLTVLHVIDENTEFLFNHKDVEEKTEAKLNEIAESIKISFSRDVHTYAQEGCACKIINATSEKLDAVMVVLGIHNKNKIQYITPKYALKKVQKSRVPYLLIPESASDISVYSKIYLPLNNLKESKESANWAAYFGRLNNSEVKFFLSEKADTGAQNNLIYARKIFGKFDLTHSEVKINVSSSGIYKQTGAYAKKENDGILVLMTGRQQGLFDKLFGTKELKILNSLDFVPCLTIAPREDLYVPCL